MIIGFIAGAFDLIHPGYIKMFREASNKCDELVVGLHIDPTLERPEKIAPILSYVDRRDILESIRYIDRIMPYKTESNLIDIIKNIKPDIRFLGEDYKDKKITGSELNIPVYYLDRSHEWSTTKLKTEIYNQIKNGKNIF